jgi:hypothetical protein
MALGLSIRAYAKRRGVRHSAVQKAIKTKRITPLPDGSIDPVAADQSWRLNTNETKPLNSVSGTPKHRRERPASVPPATELPDWTPPGPSDLTKAHTAKAAIGARREKLKLDLEEGRLVLSDGVRHGLFIVQRRGRDRLIAWASRVKQAHLGAVDTAEFDRLVDEAVADTIAELSAPFEAAMDGDQ